MKNIYNLNGKTFKLANKCIEELSKLICFKKKPGFWYRYRYAIETYRGPQLPVSVFDRDRRDRDRDYSIFAWNFRCIEEKVPKIHEYMKRCKIKGIITITFKSRSYGIDFKLLYATVSKEDYFILHRSCSAEINEDVEIPSLKKFTSLLESFDLRLKREGYPEIECNSCINKKLTTIQK